MSTSTEAAVRPAPVSPHHSPLLCPIRNGLRQHKNTPLSRASEYFICRLRPFRIEQSSGLDGSLGLGHRRQYLDEFGSRQIAYVAVSVSGSCRFSTKARLMGTKGGPAHSTPLHLARARGGLGRSRKFVRQLAHKTRLDIDVCAFDRRTRWIIYRLREKYLIVTFENVNIFNLNVTFSERLKL